MRLLSFALCLTLTALPASAQRPPRDESPAPRALLDLALGDDDAEFAALVAAADREPLGSLANPVRVGGPDGERAYLGRLRCADGSAPRIGERSETGPGGFGSVTATYGVECAASAAPAGIVMDMYHDGHAEDRAPPGFTLSGR